MATDVVGLHIRLIQFGEDLKKYKIFESVPDDQGKVVTLKISDSKKACTAKKMSLPDLANNSRSSTNPRATWL